MFPWDELDRELVRAALASPVSEAPRSARRAAVAALLADTPEGVELLLMRRAERVGDPWSGHMALPGGHADTTDTDLYATALREVREELGVDLSTLSTPLGRLDDLAPLRGMNLLVRPFVFALDAVPEFVTSSEVEDLHWLHLGRAASGVLSFEHEVELAAHALRVPALRAGEHAVWGLTYRVILCLVKRVADAVAARAEMPGGSRR